MNTAKYYIFSLCAVVACSLSAKKDTSGTPARRPQGVIQRTPLVVRSPATLGAPQFTPPPAGLGRAVDQGAVWALLQSSNLRQLAATLGGQQLVLDTTPATGPRPASRRDLLDEQGNRRRLFNSVNAPEDEDPVMHRQPNQSE